MVGKAEGQGFGIKALSWQSGAAIYGLDRFEERHWRRMEDAPAQTVERDEEEKPVSARPSARPAGRQVIRRGDMVRYRAQANPLSFQDDHRAATSLSGSAMLVRPWNTT
jgi:hypothetical protein